MWRRRRRNKGRAIAVDAGARSADPSLPGFLARPDDAPVYHGFTVLDDVEVDGFKLGVITEIGPEQDDAGDAFVVAPDNSRAGLVWELVDEPYLEQVTAAEPTRWGVWGVGFTRPMRTHSDARENLAAVVPELRRRWEAGRVPEPL
jgi:hypothetical protein